MKIGIIRTKGSPCRCAEAVAKGLETLGHQYLLVDSEEIERRASEVAGECDLVIDHTDTFRGRGFFRPLVRFLLESHGARIVGSDARACLLADDKPASKSRLAAGGIPVPPGIVVTSKRWDPPPWLTPPLVLKPAFEHMSRGLRLAQTDDEAHVISSNLLESLNQPVLVENYVPGRELAVSLLEGPDGLEVLPPVEWRVGSSGTEMLSEAFKLAEPTRDRSEAARPSLATAVEEELNGLACLAFRLLGLRDYARFDVRLSPGGTFFFLEANTTPSLEPFEAMTLSARWAGLDYSTLVERMLSAALKRYPNRRLSGMKEVRIELPAGTLKLEIPEGVHSPPPSTIELAKLMDVRPGEDVLELGCGTGVLSIAAAKLGAGRVLATDIDPNALESTRSNSRRNSVEDRVQVRAGSWYEALKGCPGHSFDIIVATPPQTPGPRPFGPRYGGFDGTKHLHAVVDRASAFLKPGGRLWLLCISLANPSSLLASLRQRFSSVSIVAETERPFTPEEYNGYEQGLFQHFQDLRAAGSCEFEESASGGYLFRNLFVRAEGHRPV